MIKSHTDISRKIPESVKIDDAFRRVISFAQHFGEPHTALAMHAALPLGLTPELLHLIRINFAPKAPWIAEADLLLSPFCKEVGTGLYEIDKHVRDILLDELKTDKDFGPEQHAKKVAKFLLEYVRQALEKEESAEMQNFLTVQKYAGLAYAYPQKAVKQLSLELLKGLKTKDYAKTIQIASLIRSLISPLIFEDKLLLYAAAVEKWATGDTQGAFNLFDAIGPRDQKINIGGISLPAPNKLIGDDAQGDDQKENHIHPARTVLICNQQKNILETLKEFLQKNNYMVFTASSAESAKKIIWSEDIDYLINEHRDDAIQFFNFARRNQPKIKTVILQPILSNR